MNNHWYNEGKEYLKKDEFKYQGRSNRQMENTYRVIGWALIGLIVSWILIFIQA